MNNKGYFDDDKSFKERVVSFFKESGFYVVIVLGLCAVAAGTVYFTTHNLLSSPEENLPEEIISNDGLTMDNTGEQEAELPIKPSQNDIIPEGTIVGEGEGPEDLGPEISQQTVSEDESRETLAGMDKPVTSPTPKPKEEPAKEKPKPTPQASLDEESEEAISLFNKAKFEMPLQGEIITDYAMDKLVYSKTLDEWRTHSGIDISAPRGEAVKAVADGVVTEMKNDPRYGITIVIDHENGYKSIYSNLGCDDMVSPNQKVKCGDAISSVGSTAIFECVDPPHLHFEMYQNNKLVDPKKYLPINQ